MAEGFMRHDWSPRLTSVSRRPSNVPGKIATMTVNPFMDWSDKLAGSVTHGVRDGLAPSERGAIDAVSDTWAG